MKSKAFNAALSGVISALAVVIMLSSAIVPVVTYAAPALAGILTAVIVIEINKKWAAGSYFVTSVIAFLIVPDKETVVLYVLFFGYYPIIKQMAEANIKSRWLQLLIETACFSAAAVASYFIAIYALGVPKDEFEIFGVNLPILFLAAGILVFWLYDYALSGVIITYVNRLRGKLFGRIKK